MWRDCTNSQDFSFIPTNYHQFFSFAHSHRQYADESLGFLIVRGENVAMMGLMGAVSRPPEIAGYKRVTVAEIKHVRPYVFFPPLFLKSHIHSSDSTPSSLLQNKSFSSLGAETEEERMMNKYHQGSCFSLSLFS